MEWAHAGESALIVGANGVGKSNLFNHLQDPAVKKYFLGDASADHIFVRVDLRELPEITNRGVYSLIIEQLELLGEKEEAASIEPDVFSQIGSYHEALLDAGDDALKVRRFFRLAVRALMQRPELHLILLVDQFDNVYQDIDPQLFANLRGLREAFKYRLSYFVFSRRLFPLTEEPNKQRAEFLELLAANPLGLKPNNKKESTILLQRLASRVQLPLDPVLAQRLIKLTGGHAGLLRNTFLALSQSNHELAADEDKACQQLLELSNVHDQCWKIWRGISTQEQRLLYNIAKEIKLTRVDDRVYQQLQMKGLIKDGESASVFSPLFNTYVYRQEPSWEKPIHLDESTRSVWIHGEKKAELTKTEYAVFLELFKRLGEVVDKEELIAAGWPDTETTIKDQTVTSTIYRIRKKIEPEPGKHRFLKSAANHGYQLLPEPAS